MRALAGSLEPRFPAAFLGHRDVLGFAILYQHRNHVEAADGANLPTSPTEYEWEPDTIRIHRAIVIVYAVTATTVASESTTLQHRRGKR
jgi:hypothetical protein